MIEISLETLLQNQQVINKQLKNIQEKLEAIRTHLKIQTKTKTKAEAKIPPIPFFSENYPFSKD